MLEDSKRAAVLPLVRGSEAKRAIEDEQVTGVERAAHDPGVRTNR